MYNEALIRTREDSIRRVQSEMLEIHEMFQDIGQLVTEQSGLLGTHPCFHYQCIRGR